MATRTFVPGGGPVADESVPWLFGGFRLTAEVDVPVAAAGEGPACEGVICALGDWNGGWALFVDGGRLVFAFAWAGDRLEVVGEEPVVAGLTPVGVIYARDGEAGGGGRGRGAGGGGSFTLFHGGRAVGRTAFAGGLPVVLQHGGAGLRLGFDTGLPVSERYLPPAPFSGNVVSVRVEAPGTPVDPVGEVRAALHGD